MKVTIQFMKLPRRTFIRLTGAAILARPSFAMAENDEVPPMLDHILLGCNDLQHGIDFVEQRTGVRAAFGGVHPGRGTENALLSLGTHRYLEIIAPDPQQPGAALIREDRDLSKLREPCLVGWAAHPGDIQVLARKLANSGVAAKGPTPGARKRPDGGLLHWKTLNLTDDASGLLPFFIEWSSDSLHPSADSPAGCQLLRFELLSPDPAALGKRTAKLDLNVPVLKGSSPQLHAVISGPKGKLDISS